MLGLVIRKEIQENFLNIRFIASCGISLLLMISSIAILTRSHEDQVTDYRSRLQQQDEFIDRFGHFNRLGWMSTQHRGPSTLQALVLGIDREAQQDNFISNPVPVLLSRLDFVSLVTVIMSLIAIMFSYNAISGEREAGVLRQVLASGVPRRTLLVGTFLGGLISLIVPFTISVLAGMLYLALSPALQLKSVDFGILALLLVLSWFYVSVFYGIGLLFSARSHTSAQAILKSLFAWVMLVLIIPNVSPFLAAQFYPIPSAAKINQEQYMIVDRERDEIVRKRLREMTETTYADLRPVVGLPRHEVEAALKSDPSLNERYRQYAKECDDIIAAVNKDQRAKAEKIGEVFEKRSQTQEELARVLTSASPLSNFVLIATDLTETGIEADNHWRRQSGEYERALGKYADAKYRSEVEKNPAYDSNDYLDLRGRPRFQYMPAGILERIEPDLPQWGVLTVFTVIFFTAAFVSFQRYDVR